MIDSVSQQPEITYRVLVVDDEAEAAATVVDALCFNIQLGGKLRFVAEALQNPLAIDDVCKSFSPDALVLDIDFTTIDQSLAARDMGLDLLEHVPQLRLQLGRLPFELPVVVMSGRLAEGDRLRDAALAQINLNGAFFVEKAGDDSGVGRIIAALEARLSGQDWPEPTPN